MRKELFDYLDYKHYINDRIKQSPSKGRGIKLKMAEHLHCQSAFISQVLNGLPHFSLEQAVKLNKFFGHTHDESKFFILLLQISRAGTVELKDFFRRDVKEILAKRSDLKNRIDIKKSLRPMDQQVYYSSWHYAAVHMLLAIKEFQYPESIADRLHLERGKVIEILNFLVQTGLAKKVENNFEIGVTRIHLDNDSPQIQRHHTNWRMQAINSIDKNLKSDLHFSTVVSMNPTDLPALKEILIKAIEDSRKIIRDSKEEQLVCLCIDLFSP